MGVKDATAENKARCVRAALNADRRLELVPLIAGEEGETRGVAVKCIDISKNPD